MPAYDYKCDNAACGAVYEIRHAIDNPNVPRCPECGAVMKKVIFRGHLPSMKIKTGATRRMR